MKITYANKLLNEIEANLEIVLLKRSKYLKTNNMFLKEKKLYVKIPNYKFYTITEIITNVIKYINKIITGLLQKLLICYLQKSYLLYSSKYKV